MVGQHYECVFHENGEFLIFSTKYLSVLPEVFGIYEQQKTFLSRGRTVTSIPSLIPTMTTFGSSMNTKDIKLCFTAVKEYYYGHHAFTVNIKIFLFFNLYYVYVYNLLQQIINNYNCLFGKI